MAKLGVKLRNKRREHMTARDAGKRLELKKQIIDESLSWEERMAARDKLNSLSPNGSKVRLRNRCMFTGRPRGNYRKFKICRVVFRDMASRGELPGVTKSSW